MAAGDVVCWGNALDEFQPELTPTRVGGVFNELTVSQLSLGHFFACAIAEGDVYCWGRGSSGQLGHGSFTGSVLPVKVGGLLEGKTVTDIAAGDTHACAIADARAYCWGAGASGNLGDGGSTSNRASPVAVGGLLADLDVTDISVGASSCAIADGRAYCWGRNRDGTSGNGGTQDSPLPRAVCSGLPIGSSRVFTEIAAGSTHTCAIAGGRLYCWGANESGQLGDGTQTVSRYPVATDMTGALAGRAVSSLTVGQSNTCVLADDGSAYCWGRNQGGALGDQTTNSRSVPTAVTAVSGPIIGIAVGASHGCAASLFVYCWGAISLGTHDVTSRLVGAPIATEGLKAPACGSHWRPLREPDRCGAPVGTEFPGFIDDLRVPGPACASGWLSVSGGMCAPGQGVPVSYRVSYEKVWSSSPTSAPMAWRWWWEWE